MFEGCTSLTKVTIGDSETDIDLTTIGSEAFQSCTALSEVYIGNAVKSIGERAFNNTGIVTLTIGTSVKTIGRSAFYACYNLKKVDIPDSVTSIGETAFYGCKRMESVTFGSGLTTINGAAFYGCISLTELAIPANVKTIADDIYVSNDGDRGVFEGCTSLKSVVIGNSDSDVDKTTIGSEAFQGCTSLESITIGRAVGSIGDRAFCDCTKLSILNYLGSETDWKNVSQGSNWYKNTGITKVTYVQ